MRPVCYKDEKENCYFKIFISQNYSDNNAASVKRLVEIHSRIEWAVQHPGELRDDLFEYEKDYDFYKIKIRDGKNKTIRILCFFDDDKLILLNAFLKPYRYKGAEKKEVDKITKLEYSKAVLYKKDYLNDKNRYEEL